MKATTFMQIAYLVAQNSKCCSWKVGAVIEKGGRIISTGYNGSPAGGKNCCDHAEEQGWVGSKPIDTTSSREDGFQIRKIGLLPEHRETHSAWSKINEVHAELNSILYAARNGTSIEGATMYVTASPCVDCSKAIAQSGIKKVVFCEAYDKNIPGWESILTNSGIEVHQISKNTLVNLNWNTVKEFCGV